MDANTTRSDKQVILHKIKEQCGLQEIVNTNSEIPTHIDGKSQIDFGL